MSTIGQDGPNPSRAMTEDEWRASLPSFGQQLGTGLGGTSFATPSRAPSASPFSTLNTWKPGPTRSNTRAIWWFVFLPLIASVAMVAVMFAQIAPYVSDRILTPANQQALITAMLGSIALMYGIAVVQVAVSIWLAYLDRKALRDFGHTATASPWWNLLMPLVYLIIRSVHVNRAIGGGTAPLTVYVALYILPGLVLGIIAGVLQFV